MREQTCCFSGHRPDKLSFGYDESTPECVALKQNLADCIEWLAQRGYTTFLSGMAQGSDIFFAEAVLTYKRTHPHILLSAVIPYRGQEKQWTSAYQKRYRQILARADESVVLGEKYAIGCMMRRNRHMVDQSSLLVTVFSGESGGTKNTLAYAAAKELTILWFNPQTLIWNITYNARVNAT